MIDSMFQAGTDQALDDQNQRVRPTPPPTPPGFFAGALSAPFRGFGAAVAEAIAYRAETLGAFGDVMGAAGTDSAGGMFATQTDKERKDSEAARRRMLDSQTPYSNEAGDLFRARAKDMMPDPEATGTAGQVLAGMVKFGAKGIGYMAGGPTGLVGFGMDEALTESDRLKQQGVDLATRSQAGAVAGAASAGSMLLPMSGATALTRFAKGAIGGEVSMVAQAAAEKAIIAHGGYDKLADTFDPFDPVALGVGLVPGLLGARFGHAPAKPTAAGVKPIDQMGLGERQALPYNDSRLDAYAISAAQREGIPPEALLAIKNAGEKSGSTATSPAGAKGVMQFMPETWRQYGKGDITDPMGSIDAGARFMKDLIKQYDGDTRAAIAHYNGGTKAGKAVHAGEHAPAAETRAYLDRADRYMHDQAGSEAGRVNAADPEAQAAARVRQVGEALDESRLTPDDDLAGRSAHQEAIETAHEQMAAGEPVNVADVVRLPSLDEFPSVSQFRDVTVGPAGLIDPKVIAPGRQLYRETNLIGLDDIMLTEHEAMAQSHFVSDNADLAIGQGENRGVRITFRPDALSGREHIKPGTSDATGREYRTDLVAPRAIQSVEMAAGDFARLRGVTKNRLSTFSRTDIGDGMVRFDRRMPHLADAEANFRAWFGDSKVVDDSGNPLRVYHGTKGDFDSFETGRNKAADESGIFFASDHELASAYSGVDPEGNFHAQEIGSVIPAFIRLVNPLTVDFAGGKHGRSEAISRAIAGGHDGVILKNHFDVGGVKDQYVVFDPKQIKSAIGNSGKFDPHSGSLTDPVLRLASAADELHAARQPVEPPAPREAAPAVNQDTIKNEPRTSTGDAAKPAPANQETAATPGPSQAQLDMATAEIQRLNPDLLVQLDGMDEPMRIGDLLERVKEEAADDAQGAKLVEVAAACALRNG